MQKCQQVPESMVDVRASITQVPVIPGHDSRVQLQAPLAPLAVFHFKNLSDSSYFL